MSRTVPRVAPHGIACAPLINPARLLNAVEHAAVQHVSAAKERPPVAHPVVELQVPHRRQVSAEVRVVGVRVPADRGE